ncbi:hypothetical protein F4Y59_02575 [Candidatus Poribacteria bacterium]|nr:hypothetical protein [Candidatus Poribacteria bacterium]MXY27031.1 hypothetical protein [Candidatus Poribacteria bacterium]MYK16885.1 hypothetical protein [Candidatus Poribacteria bacterium]
MSSIAARTYLTPEEYLAFERKATLSLRDIYNSVEIKYKQDLRKITKLRPQCGFLTALITELRKS